jgi:hypothetical protein
MTNAKLDSRNAKNLKITLCALLALLVLLNFIGFTIYRNSHSSEAVSTQLWNYFESNLFKLVTISLLLPIILLVLESHFKFIQSLLQDHLKREEAIRAEQRALAQKQRQERTERRFETIQLTQKLMNQLFDLAIQVQYFKMDGTSKIPFKNEKQSKSDRMSKIEDILRGIEEFGVSANNTVNMWSSQLKISPDDQELFIYFLNIVLKCTNDTAKYIHENIDIREISELQAALGIIWGEIKRVAHHQIITILKQSMELLELKEDNAPQDKLENIKSIMDKYRKGLKAWQRFLKAAELSRNDFLPEISGNEVNALHEALGKVKKYLKEHPEDEFYQFEGIHDLKELYNKIPRETRFCALNRNFSKEFIKYLADELGLERLVQSLIDIAKPSPPQLMR